VVYDSAKRAEILLPNAFKEAELEQEEGASSGGGRADDKSMVLLIVVPKDADSDATAEGFLDGLIEPFEEYEMTLEPVVNETGDGLPSLTRKATITVDGTKLLLHWKVVVSPTMAYLLQCSCHKTYEVLRGPQFDEVAASLRPLSSKPTPE